MVRVDDHLLAGLQLEAVERAVTRQHDLPLPARTQEEPALATDEVAHPTPLGVDLHSHLGAQERALLDEQRHLGGHVEDGDVARQRGSKVDPAAVGRSRRRRHEQRLAAEDTAFEALHQAALDLRVEIEVGGHRHHGARFGSDRLRGAEDGARHRERRVVSQLDLHAAIVGHPCRRVPSARRAAGAGPHRHRWPVGGSHHD